MSFLVMARRNSNKKDAHKHLPTIIKKVMTINIENHFNALWLEYGEADAYSCNLF